MEYSVEVEKPSNILRKLKVRVPAKMVSSRYERGLAEVQKTARLKGFRPGNVPINIVKQYYGEDIRHRIFHNLIDESFREIVREHQLKTVGSPKIDTPDHKSGEGEHDHSIEENKDLTYIATVEILPEFEVKNYKGISLTRPKVEVTDAEIDGVIDNLRDSQAELIPVGGGLVQADGTSAGRPAQTKDFVDVAFKGGVVTASGIEEREGMSGSRVIEIGSNTLIPGFEDHLIGMRAGEAKTFRIGFPEDYFEADLKGKEAEFSVNVNEVKEEKLPELTDDFAKNLGYEGVSDMREKAKAHLLKNKTEDVDRKLRNDLLQSLIENTPFELPAALVEAQSRVLAQDVANNLAQQGFNQEMIQEVLLSEVQNIRKRADSQVRASLILDVIARVEKIEVTPDEIEVEIKKIAVNMKVEEEKLREYYHRKQDKRADLEYRVREERTFEFLLGQAKIKEEK